MPSTLTGARPEAGGSGQGGEASGEMQLPVDLVDLLERGDQARLQMALAEAARQAGLNRIRLFTQRGMFARRIMELMGLDDAGPSILLSPIVAVLFLAGRGGHGFFCCRFIG